MENDKSHVPNRQPDIIYGHSKSWFTELKNGGPFHSYRTVYQPDRNFGVPPAVYPTSGMAQWPPSPLTHFSTLHGLDAGWGWVTG